MRNLRRKGERKEDEDTIDSGPGLNGGYPDSRISPTGGSANQLQPVYRGVRRRVSDYLGRVRDMGGLRVSDLQRGLLLVRRGRHLVVHVPDREGRAT